MNPDKTKFQVRNDPRSCERNLCNCVRSLKEIQDFNFKQSLSFSAQSRSWENLLIRRYRFWARPWLLTRTVRFGHLSWPVSLTFDTHIRLTLKCPGLLFSSLCKSNRVRNLFEEILYSLVFSKLLYCSTVWSGSTKQKVQKLQQVQSFAARMRCTLHIHSEYGPLATLTVCTERTIRQLLLAFGPLRFVRSVRTVRTVTRCALMS